VPTFREAGMELTLTNFGGMLGPSALPADLVARWNSEFRKLLADPVLREKAFEAQGFEQQAPSGGTPEQFAAFLEVENQKIAKVVQAIGLKLD
jgi:tripartite-type tricarboxylate transporter receptor subunit TctC